MKWPLTDPSAGVKPPQAPATSMTPKASSSQPVIPLAALMARHPGVPPCGRESSRDRFFFNFVSHS